MRGHEYSMKNFERLNWGEYYPEAGSHNKLASNPNQKSLIVLTLANNWSENRGRNESREYIHSGLQFIHMYFTTQKVGKKIMLLWQYHYFCNM